MGVELRQLAYFDAIVREGGFTRAARRLHVAQPAISAQIKQLETELGVVLIQRGSRPVNLTQAGELFLTRAQRILGQVEEARAEMDELSSLVRGTVRIAATPVLGPVRLVDAMASFRRRYPGVGLTLRSGLVAELVGELDAGAVDVVVGPEDPGVRTGHRVKWLGDEHLVLAVPAGHRLAAAGPVPLAAVRDEPFVCLPPGSGMYDLLAEAATAAGFEPRIDFQASSPAIIRELVAAGLGVALMADSTATGPGPAIAAFELAAPPRHPPIAIISPRGPAAPATRAFVAHLRRHALRPG
jgi:LysR family transcriptional regulator, transcription activator of glutamate synthase operon